MSYFVLFFLYWVQGPFLVTVVYGIPGDVGCQLSNHPFWDVLDLSSPLPCDSCICIVISFYNVVIPFPSALSCEKVQFFDSFICHYVYSCFSDNSFQIQRVNTFCESDRNGSPSGMRPCLRESLFRSHNSTPEGNHVKT